MANYETKAEARTSLEALDAWATKTGHQRHWDRPEEEAWHEAWLAGRDYQRQQADPVRRGRPLPYDLEPDPETDPVREALVAALRDVTNELQAWHDERPDPPELRDLCVTCGYLDGARSVIAAAEEPREEGPG